MKNKLLIVIMLGIYISVFNQIGFTEPLNSRLSVSIPSFKITINDLEINNENSEYPFIIYKGITYFPMTYNSCRFLGIESDWEGNAKGLSIEVTGVTAAYKSYNRGIGNKNKYSATTPNFPIKVNGKLVDNIKDEYPLLSFRDVTYFPMTWKYCVEEFGWEYSFNTGNGLIINSDNPRVNQINLPKDKVSFEGRANAIANDKFIYYEADNGRIMQVSINDLAQNKEVYELPVAEYSDGNSHVFCKLFLEEGSAFLSYHQGGATMGTDYLVRLNDDGTTTELNNTKFYIKNIEEKQFKYWVGPAPGENNLYMKTSSNDWKNIGNPNYLYGWRWVTSGNSSGGGGSKDIYLINNDLYILAYDMKSNNTTTSIYKVNINTNDTDRVTDKQVLGFTADNNNLYYESEGLIYKYSIKNNKEAVYDKIVNPKAQLESIKYMGNTNKYLVCTFFETAESKYRILVLDENDKVVFKTSDSANIDKITIINDNIYYFNETTQTICLSNLNSNDNQK